MIISASQGKLCHYIILKKRWFLAQHYCIKCKDIIYRIKRYDYSDVKGGLEKLMWSNYIMNQVVFKQN